MKKHFIVDDRIGEIQDYLSGQITKLKEKGTIKGSCSSKLSWRKRDIKEFPGYVCEYGWEVTDYEYDFNMEELRDFDITVRRDEEHGNLYFVECWKIWEENAINTLVGCGKTVEEALFDFLKGLREKRKTLCVNGAAMEGKVEKAIYKKEDKPKEE